MGKTTGTGFGLVSALRRATACVGLLLLAACGGDGGGGGADELQLTGQDELAADQARLDLSTESPSADAHVTATLALTDDLISVGGEGGVSVDESGTVYVSNFYTSVWAVSPDGDVALLSDGFDAASGNTVLPSGDLLQADFGEHKLVRIDSEGGLHDFTVGGLDGPVGVARAADGSFYVANCLGKFIARVAPEGGPAEIFAHDDRFGCPNGIAVDPLGTVFVADLNSPVIFAISPTGDVSEYVDIGGPGNGHLALLDGAMYVTQLMAHQIVRIEPDKSYRVVSGDGERGFSNGSEGVAKLSHPNGIAADPSRGLLYFNTHIGIMSGGNRGSIIMRTLYLPTG